MTLGNPKGPEIFEELSEELQLEVPGRGPRMSAADAAKRAGSLVNIKEGRVGVQAHSVSSKTRAGVGTSGRTHQSAHLVPQAVDRALGVSPLRALTVNLPVAVHKRIDRDWIPKWNSAIANGHHITAGDVQTWVSQAILKVPSNELPLAAKKTLEWRFDLELKELNLKPDSIIIPRKL